MKTNNSHANNSIVTIVAMAGRCQVQCLPGSQAASPSLSSSPVTDLSLRRVYGLLGATLLLDNHSSHRATARVPLPASVSTPLRQPPQRQCPRVTEPAAKHPGRRAQAQAGPLQTGARQMVLSLKLLLPDGHPHPRGESRAHTSPQIEGQRSPLRGPSASSEESPGGSNSGRRRMTRSSSA